MTTALTKASDPYAEPSNNGKPPDNGEPPNNGECVTRGIDVEERER